MARVFILITFMVGHISEISPIVDRWPILVFRAMCGMVSLAMASISLAFFSSDSISFTFPKWGVNLVVVLLGWVRMRAKVGLIHAHLFLLAHLELKNRFVIMDSCGKVLNHEIHQLGYGTHQSTITSDVFSRGSSMGQEIHDWGISQISDEIVGS